MSRYILAMIVVIVTASFNLLFALSAHHAPPLCQPFYLLKATHRLCYSLYVNTKVRHILNVCTACGLLLAILGTPLLAHAQSSKAIAQGFTADTRRGALVAGAIVSTKANDQRKVELAATDSAQRLVGVIDKRPLVTISSSNNEVAVVLSGATTVLVSDINGDIKTSDKIAVSPIAGVGMRATEDGQIIGTAQTAFNTSGTQTRTISDSDGKKHTVHIGFMPLQVGVAAYQAPGGSFLPPILQNAANSIAGRAVPLIRILVCGILLIVGAVTVTILVYSAIRSAMTSIGRNPLAASDIRKSMYQVLIVAFGILGGTILASYLVLRV